MNQEQLQDKAISLHQEPNVMEFENYRVYLRRYYLHRKMVNSLYSYQVLARRAGITKGHLLRLLNGSRNISESKIEQLADACKLDGAQKDYFILLVMFNQAQNETVRSVWLRELKSLNPNEFASINGHRIESGDHSTLLKSNQADRLGP